MPLQPIPVSAATAAEQTAQQIIDQVTQLAQRVSATRKAGIPAVAERPARTLPNGQVMPGQPARPAVTPEQIDAALGADNVAVLDALSSALGLDSPAPAPAPQA